jgi:REP element-mobilizing transposase RayT
MRKTEFANREYYHIFNRGVDKRDVFLDKRDYERFTLSMNLLNDEKDGLMLLWRDLNKNGVLYPPKVQPLASQRLNLRSPVVTIIAYCLNPNHYHFVLKQEKNNGIIKFMQKLGTSYTMYFNKKTKRSGALFQGRYKSIHIDSNEYLLLLSAYVSANHEIHNYPEKDWLYSSLLDYTGKRDGKLCNKEIILGQFDNNFGEYEKYVKNNINYFKDKKEDEKYIIE